LDFHVHSRKNAQSGLQTRRLNVEDRLRSRVLILESFSTRAVLCFVERKERPCSGSYRPQEFARLCYFWICLTFWFHDSEERRSNMCQYCGSYPYYSYYLPYQFTSICYPLPTCGCGYPYYGYPSTYTYAPLTPLVGYGAMPYMSRGEHRVGNCLCIC
jgi:hypothetical protein